jgi:hypothetical protein
MILTLVEFATRLAGDPDSYTNNGDYLLGNYTTTNMPYSIGSIIEWRLIIDTDYPSASSIDHTINLRWSIGQFVKTPATPEVGVNFFPTHFHVFLDQSNIITTIPLPPSSSLLVPPVTPLNNYPYRDGIYIGVDNAGFWQIILYGTHYMLEDINGNGQNGYYQTLDPSQNFRKLLFDINSNPTPLTQVPQSAYSGTADLRVTTFVQLNDYSLPPNPLITNFQLVTKKTFQPRFYNRVSGTTPPTSIAYDPEFILEIDSFPATSFSPFELTTVKFRFKTLEPIRNVCIWLIRTDKFDNTVDIGTNYQYDVRWLDNTFAVLPSFHDFPNWGPRTPALVPPATLPITIVPPQVEAQFHIDHFNITPNATYRIICVVQTRDLSPFHETHSFISPEYQVLPQIPIVPPSIVQKLNSPYNTFLFPDIPSFTPYERIESVIELDALAYITNIFTKIGSPDIQIRAKINATIFVPDGILQHVLDEAYIEQDMATAQWKQSTYPNPNSLRYFNVVNTPPAGIIISNRFIIRNDQSIPNLYTLNTSTNTIQPPLLTQDWQFQTIHIQYKVTTIIVTPDFEFGDTFTITQIFTVNALDTFDISATFKDQFNNPVNNICIDQLSSKIQAATTSVKDRFSFAYLISNIDSLTAQYTDTFTPTPNIPQLNQQPFLYSSVDTADFANQYLVTNSQIVVIAGV